MAKFILNSKNKLTEAKSSNNITKSTAKKITAGEPSRNPKPGIPLNKQMIAQLIVEHEGNVSRVGDAMGCNRHSVKNVIDKDEELTALLKSCRERQIDELEKSVFTRAMESQDTGLQCFILKTQGRHRGWDQSEAQHVAKDIASAAFSFILDQSKNPAEPKQ